MSVTVNPFKYHILDKNKNDRGVHASGRPIIGHDVQLNRRSVKFGAVIIDDIPLRAKRSESRNVVQSPSRLYMCTDIQAKKQTKILSKVRSAKDNITRLFKTNGRVSPTTRNLGAFAIPSVQQHCVQNVHPSPLLSNPSSQSDIPRVRVVTVFDSLSSQQSTLEVISSLIAYSEHMVEEHVEDFVSILRNVAEAEAPSSLAQLFTAPESQRISHPAFLLDEPPTIEEEVGNLEVDAEGVQLGPTKLTMSSSCGPLPTSDSETTYDAILAVEFATFSFDSDDIQEWSDEVERSKQAKMDAHFAYVSEALAVPVPKLSAYFSTDSPVDFTDESISDPSPVKTETSETNTSSADSSPVTSICPEESRPRLLPNIFRGLRRVRNHEDLRYSQIIASCRNSFSDLSRWSFDLDLSDSPAAGSKIGALRRSTKCNDLRRSFLSLESRCRSPSHETSTSKN